MKKNALPDARTLFRLGMLVLGIGDEEPIGIVVSVDERFVSIYWHDDARTDVFDVEDCFEAMELWIKI